LKKSGSEIILECLLEQGVDTVFGYPGGAVLNIYDALYKYSDKITHILTAHEQGALTQPTDMQGQAEKLVFA
jgi:acetolactate synthase-1/2/3 large subunit